MTKRRPAKWPIGSIHSGSLLESDLIPAFINAIRAMPRTKREHLALCRDIERERDEYVNRRIVESVGWYHTDEAQEACWDHLMEALGEYAADYFYFGASVGDSSDFGFWLDPYWRDQMIDDGVPVVNDYLSLPTGYSGMFAMINDHGNLTYIKRGHNGQDYLQWAIV